MRTWLVSSISRCPNLYEIGMPVTDMPKFTRPMNPEPSTNL